MAIQNKSLMTTKDEVMNLYEIEIIKETTGYPACQETNAVVFNKVGIPLAVERKLNPVVS